MTQPMFCAVRHFRELVKCLVVNNHCPKLLTRALVPDAALEHAQKAVERDDRVRRWRPGPESQWELLYKCSRGHVDFSSPDGEGLLPYCAFPSLQPCMKVLCSRLA